MDLHRADRPAEINVSTTSGTRDVCLDRYPRDLRRALELAECGHVQAGHAVLLRGLLDARELAHEPLQRVYDEALAVYEARYGVAVN